MINAKNGKVRAFVFDLDGTLVDSKLDLVNAVNAMLLETGRPAQPTERIASYVGHGAPQLIASALGPQSTDEQRREALAIFMKHYEQQKLEFTKPYPGVVEGLRTLGGIPMAVLTNKPTLVSIEILQGLQLAPYFRCIFGGDSFPTKKPDPAGALTIVKELGTLAAEAAMVGDSDVDIQTARNAGMLAIGVNYGFGQHNRQACPADFYVDTLAELPTFANKREPAR